MYSVTPVALTMPEPMKTVATGLHFSLALSRTGNVYSWGWNGLGQLGLNDLVDRHQPTRIPGLSGVRAIAAGQMHAVAAAPGNLFGWGMNGAGQIGLAQAKQQKPFSFLTIA